jgi:hypothetical protein
VDWSACTVWTNQITAIDSVPVSLSGWNSYASNFTTQDCGTSNTYLCTFPTAVVYIFNENIRLYGNYGILEFARIFFLFTAAVLFTATTMILNGLCILLLPCKWTAVFIRCNRHAYSLTTFSVWSKVRQHCKFGGGKRDSNIGGSVRSWLGSTVYVISWVHCCSRQ